MATMALDGGATQTLGALYAEGKLLAEASGGPCNPVAYGVARSARALLETAALLGPLPLRGGEAAVAVAGALSPEHRHELAQSLAAALHLDRVRLSTDVHTLLWANAGASPGVLVIAGTGSCMLAQASDGALLRAGGRGGVFGDEGSAYQVAVNGLRAAARAVDGAGPATALVEALPQSLTQPDFEALVGWAASAAKGEIAALSETVARCAEQGDEISRQVLEEQAGRLAALVAPLQRRLHLPSDTPVWMHGSLIRKNTFFQDVFVCAVRASCGMTCLPAAIYGPDAALCLLERPLTGAAGEFITEVLGTPARLLAPTERVNAGARTIDQLDARAIVDRFADEEACVADALQASAADLERVVQLAADALRNSGRILYIGAGTSGRLGVLDASECPPTFGVSPDLVVGIMAGGDRALRDSIEGAEDDPAAGAAALLTHDPAARDLVVGIAASGTTPFTLGALRAAQQRGARTALMCCNPVVRRAAEEGPHAPAVAALDVLIALDTGPEILAGSTRLKAGTATKVALNMITTGAMALSGRVYDGLMVGMLPSNLKLRERAARIVGAICDVSEDKARELLEAAHWDIRTATVMNWLSCGPDHARGALESAKGELRQVRLQKGIPD